MLMCRRSGRKRFISAAVAPTRANHPLHRLRRLPTGSSTIRQHLLLARHLVEVGAAVVMPALESEPRTRHPSYPTAALPRNRRQHPPRSALCNTAAARFSINPPTRLPLPIVTSGSAIAADTGWGARGSLHSFSGSWPVHQSNRNALQHFSSFSTSKIPPRPRTEIWNEGVIQGRHMSKSLEFWHTLIDPVPAGLRNLFTRDHMRSPPPSACCSCAFSIRSQVHSTMDHPAGWP